MIRLLPHLAIDYLALEPAHHVRVSNPVLPRQLGSFLWPRPSPRTRTSGWCRSRWQRLRQQNGSWNYVMAASTVVVFPHHYVRHFPRSASSESIKDDGDQVARQELRETGEMTQGFSGLGLHLGNLSRLSFAEVAFDQPGKPTGEGKGRMAEEGTDGHSRRVGLAAVKIYVEARGAGRDLAAWRHRVGRRDPTDMDHAGSRELARPHPTHSLGRSKPPFSPSKICRLGFFCLRVGRYAPVRSLAVCAQFWGAPSTAIGRCLFRSRARLTSIIAIQSAEAVIYCRSTTL